MKQKALFFLSGVFLIIVLLSGISIGEETPGYLVLIQGEKSTLHDGLNGLVLNIEDTYPYVAYLTDTSFLKPINNTITTINSSGYAAIVRDGENTQDISMVSLSNPVYSDDTKELSFSVKPLEFYDGTILRNFAEKNQNMTSDNTENVTMTRVYLEIHQEIPDNTYPTNVDPQIP